jgi:hypothetical protein
LLPVPQAEHSSTIHTRKVGGSLVISFLFGRIWISLSLSEEKTMTTREMP